MSSSRSFSMRDWVVGCLIFVLFRLLRATWRIEVNPFPSEVEELRKQGRNVIVAHFHEDEWAMLGHYAYTDMHALVSMSQDGGAMSLFLEKIGFTVARGSSSRGGASGFLSLMRGLKRAPGAAVSMAVDGPRGPRRRAKKGVVKLAAALRAPIVATSASASRAWVFKRAWSKAYVPKPFARIKIVHLPTIGSEELRKLVEREDLAELIYLVEQKIQSAKSLAKKTDQTQG